MKNGPIPLDVLHVLQSVASGRLSPEAARDAIQPLLIELVEAREALDGWRLMARENATDLKKMKLPPHQLLSLINSLLIELPRQKSLMRTEAKLRELESVMASNAETIRDALECYVKQLEIDNIAGSIASTPNEKAEARR